MGQSTDALLMYGFEIGDSEDGPMFWEDEPDEDDAPEWETFVAAKLGVPHPGDYSEDKLPEFQVYWEAKRQVIAELGVEIERHCSGDYPIYVLTVKDSVSRAWRGDAKTFDVLPIAEPDWDQQLRSFCELVGIEPKKPTWLLASYWG